MGDTAVEDAHPHQREGTRVDGRVVEHEPCRAAKRAAQERADGERRSEVAGAAARANRKRGCQHLGDREQAEQPDGVPDRQGAEDALGC